MAATVAALSASVSLVMTPTKASAFDIGGLIGAAIQMHMNAYRGAYAGGSHARNHGSHDNDSDDRGSSAGGGERDARDPDTVDRASRPDNRLAMHRQVLGQGPGQALGPSSSSGGLAQASERDALADQGPIPGRAGDGHSFK
jgi:hypothetical protein